MRIKTNQKKTHYNALLDMAGHVSLKITVIAIAGIPLLRQFVPLLTGKPLAKKSFFSRFLAFLVSVLVWPIWMLTLVCVATLLLCTLPVWRLFEKKYPVLTVYPLETEVDDASIQFGYMDTLLPMALLKVLDAEQKEDLRQAYAAYIGAIEELKSGEYQQFIDVSLKMIENLQTSTIANQQKLVDPLRVLMHHHEQPSPVRSEDYMPYSPTREEAWLDGYDSAVENREPNTENDDGYSPLKHPSGALLLSACDSV